METTILYIIVILLLGVIVYFVASKYTNKSEKFDAEVVNAVGVAPSEPDGNEVFGPVASDDLATDAHSANSAAAGGPDSVTPDCFPRDRLTSDQLLPKDAANAKWAQANPAGQGDVANVNLLSAGYHYGIDTQGSSLRNANLQLRSDPPCPQTIVSPFLNSTITPDFSRRPLE